VAGLANTGQAQTVVDLIKTQPLDAQKDILAAPYAVWGLANTGQAQTVVDSLKALPPDAQKDILAVPHAVLGLEKNGQAQVVADIKAGWNRPKVHLMCTKMALS
jgi:hypothetical protein